MKTEKLIENREIIKSVFKPNIKAQILYTEEEVKALLLKFGEEVTYPETYYEPTVDDEINDIDYMIRFNKWFEQNKKK
jgi:hypothetical protein